MDLFLNCRVWWMVSSTNASSSTLCLQWVPFMIACMVGNSFLHVLEILLGGKLYVLFHASWGILWQGPCSALDLASSSLPYSMFTVSKRMLNPNLSVDWERTFPNTSRARVNIRNVIKIDIKKNEETSFFFFSNLWIISTS